MAHDPLKITDEQLRQSAEWDKALEDRLEAEHTYYRANYPSKWPDGATFAATFDRIFKAKLAELGVRANQKDLDTIASIAREIWKLERFYERPFQEYGMHGWRVQDALYNKLALNFARYLENKGNPERENGWLSDFTGNHAEGLFAALTQQLADDPFSMWDGDKISKRHWAIKKKMRDDDGRMVNHEFFKHTVFAPLFPEPQPPDVPVTISSELPFSGTYVLAAQGYGKTTLLSKLILDRMNEPCSIIVFDTKPELSLKLRQYKFPKETVVITPDKYLALNPFDLGTHNLDILMGLFGSLGAGFTTLQSQALRQIVYLTSKVPNATFDTFYEIVATGGKKYQEVIAEFDIRERLFWDEYPGGQYRETRGQILWRLDTLTPPESLARTMFGAPTTKVKMRPLMDGNTLTIIDCTRDELGHQQTEFFGALFLAMIQAAGEQRSRSDSKRPCYIFMDEADTIISRCAAVPEIIYRLRSQRVAFLAAHQSMSQIELPKVQDALNDCAIRYVNAKNDAPKIAGSMGVDAEFIRTLRVGEFALSLQGQQAQKVKIPLPDFTYPKLTTTEMAERTKRFKENYCYDPKPPEPPKETPQQKAW